MASPVKLAMTRIAADWAGLTPPDRTAIRYHELTGRTPRTGTVADRGFVWVPEPTREVVAMAGTTQWVSWSQEAIVRLSSSGRGMDALADAVVDESQALARVVEGRSAWPEGVQDVIVADIRPETDDESGDVLLTFTFDILTVEE